MVSTAKFFSESAAELAKIFDPEKTVHLAINWQTLFCDPQFPTNRNDPQLNERIANTLRLVTQFTNSTNGLVPTWQVYHDLRLQRGQFPEDTFSNMKQGDVERRLEEFQREATTLCLPVHETDVTLRKPLKSVFLGTDLAKLLRRHKINTVLVSGINVAEALQDAPKSLKLNTFVIEDYIINQTNVTAVAGKAMSVRPIDAAGVKQVLGL